MGFITRYNPSALMLLCGFALSVAALVVMLSIGEASRQKVLTELPMPAENEDFFFVKRSRHGVEQKTWPISRDQILRIRQIENISAATVSFSHTDTIKYSRWHTDCSLDAIDEDFDIIWFYKAEPAYIVEGRAITDSDIEAKASVCTVPVEISERLHIESPGATVRIDGRPYKVVGFTKDLASIQIPVTNYAEYYGDRLYLRIYSSDISAEAMATIKRSLREIFQTDDDFIFMSQWQKSIKQYHKEAVEELISQGLIGAVPLLMTFFGALGISVAWLQERKWNFAILRALGATRFQVAVVAAKEPLAIVSVGALLGLGMGLAIALIIKALIGLPVAFNWRWFVLACTVGLTAMFVPALVIALRAAYVHPAEAMRR